MKALFVAFLFSGLLVGAALGHGKPPAPLTNPMSDCAEFCKSNGEAFQSYEESGGKCTCGVCGVTP